MIMYLSGVFENLNIFDGRELELFDFHNQNILFSFAKYFANCEKYIPLCRHIMIDSGAFTFMNSTKNADKLDYMKYAKKYGQFVKRNNIEDFIELDIDSIVDFQVYKDCLHCLQDITGKEPLRAWHIRRGFQYYEHIVQRYKKICIGGIVTKEISIDNEKLFNALLMVAHKYNCKVHGLGIGSGRYIRKYDFDSVDSASWLSSMRIGQLQYFDGHEINHINWGTNPDGGRLERKYSGRRALGEWSKYVQYLKQF